MSQFRQEKDSMGTIEVPINALYSAQTQRAVENFPISGISMPKQFIRALGLLKAACAKANLELDLLDLKKSKHIIENAQKVAENQYDNHFPIDIFQTGSGTSTNMNANEVIANLCKQQDIEIHPNDDVNKSQSSNDVIPTCIHLSASLYCHEHLIPKIKHLCQVIHKKGKTLSNTPKTGRTHLMDAMPVTFGQELACWQAQLEADLKRLEAALKDVQRLPIGGTAVGTGINAPSNFGDKVCHFLQESTQIEYSRCDNLFEFISAQDGTVHLSGVLKTIACTLMKISNDLRWMNSGPLAGLAEISLPSLQPGSSIMPGKVNPVICESVNMVCAQVIGNDTTITIAGQSGNFQLNVMLPVIAYNLLQSIEILGNAAANMADKAILNFEVLTENVDKALARNPILVTALNTVIGYELGAKIAKTAYQQNRSVLDVAKEMTDLSESQLKQLLDPIKLTKGGLPT